MRLSMVSCLKILGALVILLPLLGINDIQVRANNPPIYYTDWSIPIQISSTGVDPRIFLDNHGFAHILWRINQDVYYTDNTSGNWAQPINLSNNPTAEYDSTLYYYMVIDKSDILHIVWDYNRQLEGTTSYIRYKRYDPTSGWSSTINIANGYRLASPIIAMDNAGGLHVAFIEGWNTSAAYVDYIKRTSPDNQWLPLERVTREIDRNWLYFPTMVVNSRNQPIIAWWANPFVQFSIRDTSGSWSIPEVIGNPAGNLGNIPTLAIDSDDTIYAYGNYYGVLICTKPIDEGWTCEKIPDIPDDSSYVGFSFSQPSMVIDSARMLFSVFGNLEFTPRDSNGVWEYTRFLNSSGYTENPTIALDNLGFLHIVYSEKQREGIYYITTHVPCKNGGWYANYYDNLDLIGTPVVTRCDQNIDFFWGENNPDPLIIGNIFSVRWNKTAQITTSGWYRFRVFEGDKSSLFVDGNKIIDDQEVKPFHELSTVYYLDQGTHNFEMDYFHQSTDAEAKLNWYLCPNGYNDCTINITPLYQTSYLDQPMPKTCLTEANATIARWGCLITSSAMALQKLGINTNPSELNDWLSTIDTVTKKPKGYLGICDATLNGMDQIIAFAKDKYKVDLEWQSLQNKPITDVISVIRNKHLPIILRGAGHFKLAVDVTEENGAETLGINDPWHSFACGVVSASPALPPKSILSCGTGPLKHATTLSEESQYHGGSVPFGYLQFSTKPRSSSIQFSIKGAELMITTSDGKRVGYNPLTGDILLDIPNSFYFDSKIIPPGEIDNGAIERGLFLPEDAWGSYQLTLTGVSTGTGLMALTDNQEFELSIVGVDGIFNSQEISIQGNIGSGIEYQVVYSDQGLSIDETHKIYLPLISK